jgi:hypothetical protein
VGVAARRPAGFRHFPLATVFQAMHKPALAAAAFEEVSTRAAR